MTTRGRMLHRQQQVRLYMPGFANEMLSGNHNEDWWVHVWGLLYVRRSGGIAD